MPVYPLLRGALEKSLVEPVKMWTEKHQFTIELVYWPKNGARTEMFFSFRTLKKAGFFIEFIYHIEQSIIINKIIIEIITTHK
jgi:hypothetical protein